MWPPVVASHTCTLCSPPKKRLPLPEARRVPSGDQVTALTVLECGNVKCRIFVRASHTCTVVSLLAEAMCFPSGDQATAGIRAVCPVYVRMRSPVEASQIWTVLSSPPEAIRPPSGDQATH